MRTFVKIIGGGWALIGLGNIVYMPWTTMSSGFLTFGLAFNILLFFFPGMVLYMMADRKKETN